MLLVLHSCCVRIRFALCSCSVLHLYCVRVRFALFSCSQWCIRAALVLCPFCVHALSVLCSIRVMSVLCSCYVRAVFVLCSCCVRALLRAAFMFSSCCVHVLFVLYVRAVFASVRELFCNHMSRNSNLVSSPSLTEAILIYLLTCSVGAKPELEIHSLQKFAVSDTQLHAPIMSVSFLYYFPPNGPTRANTKTAQQTLV